MCCTPGVRAALLLTLASGLAGCTWDYASSAGDPDARPPDAPYMPPTNCGLGYPSSQTASCEAGTAHVSTIFYFNMGGTHSMCTMTHAATVPCASGCAVETSLELFNTSDLEIADLGEHAEVLCAETPEAKVGDVCGGLYTGPNCRPTRAHLNADGTVASQNYLACDYTTKRCVTSGAPIVSSYLQACDSATVANHSGTDVKGRVKLTGTAACLLAYDSSTSTMRSGVTRVCLGDWDCPAGSLCDDMIPALDAITPLAVCKPGPRGSLTPAMLSP